MMRVTKFKSDKIVLIKYNNYKIDWKNDGDSKLESLFMDLIYEWWRDQIVLFQFRIPGSLLRIDFLNVNKRLAVEVDGPQHEEFNKFFHNNSRNSYGEYIKRDWEKENWCDKNDIKLIRLNKDDLYNFSPSYILKNFGISIT